MPANPTLPMNLTLSTDPTPTAVTTVTLAQMPVVKLATMIAKFIPVTVYNLAQGKFKEIPYPERKSQRKKAPPPPVVTVPLWNSNPKLQPLPQPCRTERTPHGQIPCQPLMTCLLREYLGKSPYNGEVPTPTFVKMEKAEDRAPPRLAAIHHALVLNKPKSNKPAEEECRWGPHCPIWSKSTPNPKAESTEDWNFERQNNHQRNYYPQSPRWSPAYDIPDRFSQQYKLQKEWNVLMTSTV